jgi:hypothetical protein
MTVMIQELGMGLVPCGRNDRRLLVLINLNAKTSKPDGCSSRTSYGYSGRSYIKLGLENISGDYK